MVSMRATSVIALRSLTTYPPSKSFMRKILPVRDCSPWSISRFPAAKPKIPIGRGGRGMVYQAVNFPKTVPKISAKTVTLSSRAQQTSALQRNRLRSRGTWCLGSVFTFVILSGVCRFASRVGERSRRIPISLSHDAVSENSPQNNNAVTQGPSTRHNAPRSG
jgi:hypothetical protein